MNEEPKPKDRSADDRLMSFMRGWRKAAAAAATTKEQMADPEFVFGHKVGRTAVCEMYEKACAYYGTKLSPLRGIGD